ncbi:Smr protein/MutS2 C-terminal [Tricharina praecox]|uniref:Smr protein/MutS2 C-terminal n=1 Tax=Tricharina praecox TaxID=43433 RepID=UPI0022203459|nr:Smr protein/MutS2 C-terminal [Tricharina praecox]KAI5854204.1 Smr protein/MutS2 C-terminal [Tricharina praecox]
MVDLHGLYVAEAIARVKRHLERCAEAGVDRTTIITGRGLHSQGGVARIKPEVEKWLGEHVAQYRVLAGANGGAFTVELMQEEQKGVLGGVWKFLGW